MKKLLLLFLACLLVGCSASDDQVLVQTEKMKTTVEKTNEVSLPVEMILAETVETIENVVKTPVEIDLSAETVARESVEVTIDNCDWPKTVMLDNATLVSLGMPELPGGAQMEFNFDESNNIIEANSLINLSTGPNFVTYTFDQSGIKSAQFIADAFTPIFDENGDFVEIDYNALVPLQDTVFVFNDDGSVDLQNNKEPNMEELMLILNPPLEPYEEWFQFHWESTYEFFELWKAGFCAQK